MQVYGETVRRVSSAPEAYEQGAAESRQGIVTDGMALTSNSDYDIVFVIGILADSHYGPNCRTF